MKREEVDEVLDALIQARYGIYFAVLYNNDIELIKEYVEFVEDKIMRLEKISDDDVKMSNIMYLKKVANVYKRVKWYLMENIKDDGMFWKALLVEQHIMSVNIGNYLTLANIFENYGYYGEVNVNTFLEHVIGEMTEAKLIQLFAHMDYNLETLFPYLLDSVMVAVYLIGEYSYRDNGQVIIEKQDLQHLRQIYNNSEAVKVAKETMVELQEMLETELDAMDSVQKVLKGILATLVEVEEGENSGE